MNSWLAAWQRRGSRSFREQPRHHVWHGLTSSARNIHEMAQRFGMAVRNALPCAHCKTNLVVECARPTNHVRRHMKVRDFECPACRALNTDVTLRGGEVVAVSLDPRSRRGR